MEQTGLSFPAFVAAQYELLAKELCEGLNLDWENPAHRAYVQDLIYRYEMEDAAPRARSPDYWLAGRFSYILRDGTLAAEQDNGAHPNIPADFQPSPEYETKRREAMGAMASHDLDQCIRECIRGWEVQSSKDLFTSSASPFNSLCPHPYVVMRVIKLLDLKIDPDFLFFLCGRGFEGQVITRFKRKFGRRLKREPPYPYTDPFIAELLKYLLPHFEARHDPSTVQHLNEVLPADVAGVVLGYLVPINTVYKGHTLLDHIAPGTRTYRMLQTYGAVHHRPLSQVPLGGAVWGVVLFASCLAILLFSRSQKRKPQASKRRTARRARPHKRGILGKAIRSSLHQRL